MNQVETILVTSDWLQKNGLDSAELGSSFSVRPWRICVPLPSCTCAPLGEVSRAVVDTIESQGFGQAPVEVPDSPIGWRLASTSVLREFATTGRPLQQDTGSFLESDTFQVPPSGDQGRLLLRDLFDALCRTPATILFDEFDLPDGRKRRRIFGLVTRSDLNRRVIRVAMYDAIATVERALANLVRSVHPDGNSWIPLMSGESQSHLKSLVNQAKGDDVDLDPIHWVTLADLLTICKKSPEALARLGPMSKTEFSAQYGRLAELRNRVMHPVHLLVHNANDLTMMRRASESAEDLVGRLGGY